jgi:5'-3' exonuclease
MTIALIDADVIAYRVSFACKDEPQEKAASTLSSLLEEILYSELDIDKHELFLTGKGNFRNEVAVTVPYKQNRVDKERPLHLDFLRSYMSDAWSAVVSENEEADDLIAIRATELGDDSIMVSIDKDFNQVPGWHYNFVKKDKYYVTAQDGLRFFYKQILMGDRVDNIVGIKGVGEKRAEKMLADAKTEQELYAVCSEALGEDRVIENGRLLWLRREKNQLWCPPSSD